MICKSRWPLILLTAMLGGGCHAQATTAFNAQVIRVLDGDSIIVKTGKGRELEIRLFGIDAPEHGQPGGESSRLALRKLANNKMVRIQVVDRDQYGRQVAWVELDGKRVNVDMVRNGWAWWYQQFAPDNRELRNAQESARKARRGIWAGDAPIAPWQWRRMPENKRPVELPPKYWMNHKSGIRHTPGCRYFQRGEGQACEPDEGQACKICGG